MNHPTQVTRITADGEGMQTMSARWFGAGHSTASDSAKAGAEATAEALSGRTPAVLFVFASPTHDSQAVLRAVRADAGSGPVIVGGTSLGEISSAGSGEQSVVVGALGGDGLTIRTRVAQIDGDGHRRAGAAAAGVMSGMDRPHSALMLLCDGLSGDPHEIVRGAYSVVGAAVPMVGGLMADRNDHKQTLQFYGEGDDAQVLTNAVIGIGLGSDGPLGIGIAHGWRRTEPAMIATRCSGGKILEIDGKPALDVLAERLGIEASAQAMFGDGLLSIGLSRRSGEDVRVLHGGDDEERSVRSLAEVPQGALFWVMEGDLESLITGARESCAEALAALDGAPAVGVLAFDCGGRLTRLGEPGARAEIAAMTEVLGDIPFAGLYTMGEVARARGALGLHHLTLVTLAMA
jgi:hypothetical protein